jgi:hypothetical protein
MAGCDATRGDRGRDEPIGDRLGPVWVRLLTLVLLLVASGLAAFPPAPAIGRPVSSATDPMAAARPGGPFATNSGEHGIENRDPAPPTCERRAARGVDSFAPQTHPSDQSLPARRARLQRRIRAVPSSRAAGGNSSRAPPRPA